MKKLAAALVSAFFLLNTCPAEAGDRPLPPECTYEMQVWNVNLKSSVGINPEQNGLYDNHVRPGMQAAARRRVASRHPGYA